MNHPVAYFFRYRNRYPRAIVLQFTLSPTHFGDRSFWELLNAPSCPQSRDASLSQFFASLPRKVLDLRIGAGPIADGLDLRFGLCTDAAQCIRDLARLCATLDCDASAVRGKIVAPAVGRALARRIEKNRYRSRSIAIGAGAVIMLDDEAEIIELTVNGA